MPLEIRELVIRTTINGDVAFPGDADREISNTTQAAIIAACVDQVLAVLRARAER